MSPIRRSPSRYGHAAHDVLALAAERGELAQPIVAGSPDLLAEVALAARREQARSIGDVLLRRTRLGLLAARELTPRSAGDGHPESAAPRRGDDGAVSSGGTPSGSRASSIASRRRLASRAYLPQLAARSRSPRSRISGTAAPRARPLRGAAP